MPISNNTAQLARGSKCAGGCSAKVKKSGDYCRDCCCAICVHELKLAWQGIAERENEHDEAGTFT